MDTLAENHVDRRDAHIHAVNHSRVGGDPGVSMAPCDDESTDTIKLYNKRTHRCISVMSNHCVSRPQLGLTHRACQLPSMEGINTVALSLATKTLTARARRVQPRFHELLIAQSYFS